MFAREDEPGRRRLFSSARARILASYLILLLFSTAVATVVLREVLLARAGERVDDALVQETREFRRLAEDGRNPETGELFGDDVRAIFDVFLSRNVPGEEEAFYTYVDGAAYEQNFAPALEERRLDQIDALASTTATRRGEFELEDETRFRYVAVPVEDTRGRPRGVFAVVIDLDGELDEVNEALQIAVGVNVGVLILASMLAWVIAGRVLEPLRLLRDTARSISESDLTRRIPVEGEDELADLARTFNEMLDRLEEAFGSQKAFISDAGHELRTPITIIRGHLDVMGDDPEERRETLELVGDELDRMSRLVNDLLLLAKAPRPDFLQPETVDLDDLTHELYRQGLGARRARLAARAGWRRSHRGRQAAHHAGRDEPEPERGHPHAGRRRRRARLRASQRQRVPLGRGHRAGRARARAGPHLRALRAARPRARRRGRRAGPCDNPRRGRGPRRTRRA